MTYNKEELWVNFMQIASIWYEFMSIYINTLREIIDPKMTNEDALKFFNIFLKDKKEDLPELALKYPIISDSKKLGELWIKIKNITSKNKKHSELTEELMNQTMELIRKILKSHNKL